MWCKHGSEFQGLFKVTIKIQDLFKIVRTMKAIAESTLGKDSSGGSRGGGGMAAPPP